MSLPVPYIVFGVVRDSGSPVDNAKVYVNDSVTYTDSEGRYRYDLQDIANNGETITIRANHDGKHDTSSFTLNISHGFKSVNLDIDVTDLSDTVTLSDNVSSHSTFFRDINDSISLSDNVLKKEINKLLSDTFVISDNFTSYSTITVILSDTCIISDNVSDIAGFIFNANDSCVLSDSLSKIQVSHGISDTLDISDSFHSIYVPISPIMKPIRITSDKRQKYDVIKLR
jgi:hypothetical protein